MKFLMTTIAVITLVGCASNSPPNPATANAVTESKEQDPSKKPSAAAPPTGQASTPKSPVTNDKAAEQPTTVNCKLEKDERVLEIIKSESLCELNYTKFGETNPIASGDPKLGHCERVRDKVRGNLENFGYVCH